MTRATGNANSRFRQRKLSTRQTLPVVREHDLQVDAESHQNVAKVETGVEKAEETVGPLLCIVAPRVPDRSLVVVLLWSAPSRRRLLSIPG